MIHRLSRPAALAVALALTGCATNSAPEAETTAVELAVDCPCCFTIVEFVRSDPPRPGDSVEMQCPMCCETLTFTTPGAGATHTAALLRTQLQMSTSTWPQPMPVDLAAPMR
ncbi:MAG: hypothetical protein AB7O97_04945 [Planctomycetota bacterium]